MKHFFAMALAVLISGAALAQDLPMPSPFSNLSQVIGLTTVSLEYSRPGVKERTIFGDLVPYDKVWRTGANKATMINFDSEVMINGTKVPAGSYSLFTIPGKSEWTIILNKETELWGTSDYKQGEDQLRLTAKPSSVAMVESMTFGFSNIKNDKATLALSWEKTMVSFDISVDVDEQAWANVEKAVADLDNAWRTYTRSAQYCLRANTHPEKGMEWIDMAVEMSEGHWWPLWVKAELQAQQKDYKGAAKTLKKSIASGSENKDWGYKERLEKLLKEYETKA